MIFLSIEIVYIFGKFGKRDFRSRKELNNIRNNICAINQI